MGFGFVSYLSVRQALQARRLKLDAALHTEAVVV
jgi:hypothetical protein